MIELTQGDLLRADVDALVNTVNTKGVMGKGVALQFKHAFPANYTSYRLACQRGEVRLGHMFVFDNGLKRPHYIVNFPTKDHWKGKSRLAHIAAGLDDLVKVISDLQISSIAIPPLGCGNGGLEWSEVKPLIERKLEPLTHVRVALFPPGGAPPAKDMVVHTEKPRITAGRAALIGLINRYSQNGLGATPLEVQKLLYFLQTAGEPLKLTFAKGHYGPYAENVNHVLQAVEGHYLRGYGDRSERATEATPIELLEGVSEEVENFLQQEPATVSRLRRVVELVEGFESPYGLELLASVHYAATSVDSTAASDRGAAVRIVQNWNRRKSNLFTERHVMLAWERLNDAGWL
ncbi:MAG: type II toxin-antitoxin system antitoxin DNA ADP-ribosyl glycohydrolase DarG [Egibacteraceae bacterium]